uniref:Si:dkey-256h2.1 n=1 Tax=Oncorhynchus mykiss TaxID=8022 RepID=A0A8C7NPS5_ONCMY
MKSTHNLDYDERAFSTSTFAHSTVNFRSKITPQQVTVLEPGNTAPAFYGLNWPLVIPAFTNKSAFLVCLWNSESSLTDLVQDLPDILSRLHFSPVPVFGYGNWIPSVLYSWGRSGHNYGLSHAVCTSTSREYSLCTLGLMKHRLIDAGDGCEPAPSAAGFVAWRGIVLVHARPGNPIQDMNCVGDKYSTPLGIPAAIVHREPSVAQALRYGHMVTVSFQSTPSPNFFIGIDQQGALSEMGWFLYPSFKFINWQAQWFNFCEALQTRLRDPAWVVPVFEEIPMQGQSGAVATISVDMLDFDMLELDAFLFCPSQRNDSHWDHTVQLFVCCNDFSPHCNMEMGRCITAFPQVQSVHLTDSFTLKTPTLNRFPVSNHSSKLYPLKLMSLYSGGTFDKEYNRRHQPIKFTAPASTKKVELYAVIPGHGRDRNSCGKFCVTAHHFLVKGAFNHTRIFDSAGSALGCAMWVGLSAPSGRCPTSMAPGCTVRGGWCGGLQVNPWRIDITTQVIELSPDLVMKSCPCGSPSETSLFTSDILLQSFLMWGCVRITRM